MANKIDKPSQIKSTESETVLTEFQSSGLNKFTHKFIRDLIISILGAEDKPAKLAEQDKEFNEKVEKERKDIANKLAPLYIERLQELGFPDKEIDFELHKKEIKLLLKKLTR